ncbi:MAG: xanthine dehydrogenase family protein subunit M [Deltaproteobacteria bacterium]|nr:xanthine dehydrogenase family protein subunit M [Deltaproteobacteria bacterium]
MRRFELTEPRTLEEACLLLSDDADAKAMAGGTALLTLIKHGLFIPKTVVNLNKIQTASAIDYDAKRGLRIGALTSIFDVESSPVVRQYYPVLAQACHLVANIRIRNMATIGGNLAHGDYQSDPPTALVALDASVELMQRNGTRQMKLSEFLLGSYETALEPGELLSAVLVPPPDEWRGTYIKFTTGSSEERPCAGVAALARMEHGICRDLRLVVGAVSPRPVRLHGAEELARGKDLTQSVLQELGAEASRMVDPIDDLRGPAKYKRQLVDVLVRRAVAAAMQK